MKFTTNSANLLAALNTANVKFSGLAINPSVNSFLFKLNGDDLSIASTDIRVTVETDLNVMGGADGEICVQDSLLLETLKAIPNQPLEFYTEDNCLVVLHENSTNKIPLVDIDSFKLPGEIDGGAYIRLEESDLLIKSLNDVIFATHDEQAYAAMCGVYFNVEDDHILMAATNTKYLAEIKLSTVIEHKGFKPIVIPKESLNKLSNILIGDCTILFGNRRVVFENSDFRLTSLLVDDTYPDYKSILPTENNLIARIDRVALLSKIKLSNIYADISNSVTLLFSDNYLEISASNLDLSRSSSNQMRCEYSGSEIKIKVNGLQLQKCLNHIHTDEVELKMSHPEKPLLINPVDTEDYISKTTLLMPLY